MGTEVEGVGRTSAGVLRGMPAADRGPGTHAEPRVRAPALPGEVGLVFEVSRDMKDLIIKIVDRQTDRVLRQIPPEEMQRIRAAMRELVGLLVDRIG